MPAKHIQHRHVLIDETYPTQSNVTFRAKTRTQQSTATPSKRKRRTNVSHRKRYPHSSDRCIRKKIAEKRKLKNQKSAKESREFRRNREKYLDKQLPKGLALKALLQKKITNNTQTDCNSDSDEVEIKNILQQMVDNSGIEYYDYPQIMDNKQQIMDDFICEFLNDYVTSPRNNKIDDLYLENLENEPEYKEMVKEMETNPLPKKNNKKATKRRKQSAPKQIKLGIPRCSDIGPAVSVHAPHIGSSFNAFFNAFSEGIKWLPIDAYPEPARKKRKKAQTPSITKEKEPVAIDCNMEEKRNENVQNEWWDESCNDTMPHNDVMHNYSSNNVSPTASIFAGFNYSPAPPPLALHFAINPYNQSATYMLPSTPISSPSSIASSVTPRAATPMTPPSVPMSPIQHMASIQCRQMIWTPTTPTSQPLYVKNLIPPTPDISANNHWHNSDALNLNVSESLSIELNMLEPYAYPKGCTSYPQFISKSKFT